jgi:hypothetical protein
MSLKAFHVFFIVISTLLAVGFGVWGTQDFAESGSLTHLGLGVGSLVGSVLLVRYGFWFMRKLKDVSYL